MTRPSALRLFGCLLIAGALYVLFLLIRHGAVGSFWFGMLVFPVLFGFAMQLVYDPTGERSKGAVFVASLVVIGALVAILLFFAVETVICVAIASVIFLPLTFVGIVIARATRLIQSPDVTDVFRVSFVIVPVLAHLFGFQLSLQQGTYTVSTQMRIDAPPEAVWAQIMDFPTVRADERLWTISHNLLGATQPIASYVEGDIRHADWTLGVHYEEHLTEVIPARAMSWDLHFGDDFHMDGFDTHLSPNSEQMRLTHGRYTLQAEAGATQLTLETDYTLRTPLNAYVSLWGERFLQDNHSAVMHVLKLRAERAHQ